MHITQRQKNDPKVWIGQVLRFLFLAFHLVITAFPFYWMLNTSLKGTQAEIYSFPVVYWPENPTFKNFINIAVKGKFLVFFRNSFVYAGVASIIGVVFAVMSAYVLSRLRFKARNAILMLFLGTQMLPGFVGLAVKYQMLSKMGLVNSVLGIIILYTAGVVPYSVVTLRSFFDGVPASLEEAALIDGCNRIQTMLKISVPLMLPGIASVIIFDFVNTWNDFATANLFIDSTKKKTIAVALYSLIQNYDIAWGELMAGTIIAILPTMILFSFLRKYMIAGLVNGAVKG